MQAHSWNCPTMTVWQRPPRSTRSPSSRQCKHAGALARLKRGELGAAEALRPIRHERRMRRAGHRILVDSEIRHEHAARRCPDRSPRAVTTAIRWNACERGEIGLHRADRRFVGDLDDRRVIAAVGEPGTGCPAGRARGTAPARATSRQLWRRQIELEHVVAAADDQHARTWVEKRTGSPVDQHVARRRASRGRTARPRRSGVNQRRS